MEKKIFIGKTAYSTIGRRSNEVYVTVKLTDDGNFSAQGETWNQLKTKIIACGQNLEEILSLFPDNKKLQRIVEIWRRWHLNDMKAGCEHQREEKWEERPIDPSKPLNVYRKHFIGQSLPSWNMLTWITPNEHPEGLLTKPCSTCGYKYGTSWLKEEIPQEIQEDIRSW